MMILLDKPYISDFFRETIRKNGFPVLKNDFALGMGLGEEFNLVDEQDAINRLKNNENPLIYMPTENPLGWVIRNLRETRLPSIVKLFKDKVRSRDLMKDLYPGYFYRQVSLAELNDLDISGFPLPFIIKPSVGFFSLAVFKVEKRADWEEARRRINGELETVKKLFPSEVVDLESLIIEAFIEGEEYAFDAFFDREGEPTVYSTYRHVFASREDVSDRLYLTSAEIVRRYVPIFTEFLASLGSLADLRNFPLHVEVRVDGKGGLVPIEINPLRFGGMCTTADLACHAYGYNPYEYCFRQRKPDWDSLLRGREEHVYGLVVLNNSTGIEPGRITGFDYEALERSFAEVLEIRRVNYRELHFFGFAFIRSRKDNYRELENILHSDLREFVTT